MGNFNKFDKGRGSKGFGGGGHGFGGHGGGPRPMFQAICSKCGQNCEVPFKPTGDRPVFCSNCFKSQKQDGGGGQRFVPPKSFGGGGNAPAMGGGAVSKGQFDALNAKLDRIISLLSAGRMAETPKVKAVEVKAKKEPVKKAKATAKKGKGRKK